MKIIMGMVGSLDQIAWFGQGNVGHVMLYQPVIFGQDFTGCGVGRNLPVVGAIQRINQQLPGQAHALPFCLNIYKAGRDGVFGDAATAQHDGLIDVAAAFFNNDCFAD